MDAKGTAMSARRRAGSGPTAIPALLRALVDAAAPGLQSPGCDAVPSDFALPEVPFACMHATVDAAGTAAVASLPAELRAITRARRRDLLGIAWCLTALAPDGRAAVRVPDGFLVETTQGHVVLRRALVESARLHGVLRLAPETGRARAPSVVLLLGPAAAGTAVWFGGTDVPFDPAPGPGFDEPDCLARWRERNGAERDRTRADSSFLVPRAEIVAADFDLTPARYRSDAAASTGAVAPAARPHEILAELAGLEAEILQGIRELAGLLRP